LGQALFGLQALQPMAHSYTDRLKAFVALLTTNAVVDKKCGHQDSTAANETGVAFAKNGSYRMPAQAYSS
jgi:hypothetical protein